MTTAIILAIQYAWSFVGRPYRWGGDDPLGGFDCSGFVIEVLQGVGILPRSFDTTASGLFDRYPKVDTPGIGILAFWRNSEGRISHVELCISDTHTLGASGGGSGTRDIATADFQNAFVKLRPIRLGAEFADPFFRERL